MNDCNTPRLCPRCGQRYAGFPALSRYANVDICPDCGTDEALRGLFGAGPLPFSEWASPPQGQPYPAEESP